ncbi:MAG: nucleoside hydrolase [Gammaproteobacteria bacterium]|nr:nucleoside hydrolase [Gammaproteobacteria bacterium]
MPAKPERRFIIDTDTASDDAVALIMALRHPDVQVEAITLVAGNVALEQASVNARYTIELCQASVPVYEGCAKPLTRAAEQAQWFHGADGMGNMNYPPPRIAAEPDSAIDQLIERFRRAPGELTLVTLGPLTNIATVLTREPAFAGWVKECFVMGGAACTVGNVSPAAEYNIWCDPEAAHKVFHAGLPLTMIGWELSRGEATLDDAEIARLKALDTPLAHFAMDCNSYALKAVRELQGEAGMALADPVAMAVALDTDACRNRSAHFVDISCDEQLTRGMTVVDQLNVTGKPANATVCWSLDAANWKQQLFRALGPDQSD